MDAWYATVRVEGRGVSWPPGKCPRQRMRRGSGIVIKLTNEGRKAVIATNSHIVTCGDESCELRVGFGESSSPCSPKWSSAVHVVSRKPQKDHEFCASPDSHKTGECVHVAISSLEVIKEFEQFYSSRLTLADCTLPSRVNTR